MHYSHTQENEASWFSASLVLPYSNGVVTGSGDDVVPIGEQQILYSRYAPRFTGPQAGSAAVFAVLLQLENVGLGH